MKAKDFIAKVTAMALPVCEANGLTLWDVTFEKEGASFVLTVYIDKDEGVFIEDCERVSRTIDPMLDAPEFDSIPSYMLTVSSAGLERRLCKQAHYDWARGKQVELNFYKARSGSSSLVAVLEEHTAEGFCVTAGGETVTIPDSEVASCRLYFEF
ncbi:MAG: ribosome maturation factor RimP [Clostridia bacterium]|nr:ribosome maturation factor RimP [Clostridia bacterium]